MTQKQSTPEERAYRALLPQLLALSSDALEPTDLDLPAAVETVLSALPDVLALAPDIAQHLPTIHLKAIKNLELYALALRYTHAQYLDVLAASSWSTLFESAVYESVAKVSLSVEETAVLRQRAWTLLLLAYDEARCAIHFLRWKEDDVEAIAPSLYREGWLRLISVP